MTQILKEVFYFGDCESSSGGDKTYINNCYVKGTFNSSTNYKTAGGLVGRGGYTYFTNCYTALTSSSTVRDPIKDGSDASSSGLFYNSTLYKSYKQSTPEKTALSTAGFNNKRTFVVAGYNFTNTWIMKDGYPELRCFLSPSEISALSSQSANGNVSVSYDNFLTNGKICTTSAYFTANYSKSIATGKTIRYTMSIDGTNYGPYTFKYTTAGQTSVLRAKNEAIKCTINANSIQATAGPKQNINITMDVVQ